MAEYIERKALFKTVEDYVSIHPVMNDNELFALFCSIPAADVRPVVLCGECKNFSLNSCMRWADGTFMERTDFCSRGVKREKS